MESNRQNKLPDTLGKKIIQALKSQSGSEQTKPQVQPAAPEYQNAAAQMASVPTDDHGLETFSQMNVGDTTIPYETTYDEPPVISDPAKYTTEAGYPVIEDYSYTVDLTAPTLETNMAGSEIPQYGSFMESESPFTDYSEQEEQSYEEYDYNEQSYSEYQTNEDIPMYQQPQLGSPEDFADAYEPQEYNEYEPAGFQSDELEDPKDYTYSEIPYDTDMSETGYEDHGYSPLNKDFETYDTEDIQIGYTQFEETQDDQDITYQPYDSYETEDTAYEEEDQPDFSIPDLDLIAEPQAKTPETTPPEPVFTIPDTFDTDFEEPIKIQKEPFKPVKQPVQPTEPACAQTEEEYQYHIPQEEPAMPYEQYYKQEHPEPERKPEYVSPRYEEDIIHAKDQHKYNEPLREEPALQYTEEERYYRESYQRPPVPPSRQYREPDQPAAYQPMPEPSYTTNPDIEYMTKLRSPFEESRQYQKPAYEPLREPARHEDRYYEVDYRSERYQEPERKPSWIDEKPYHYQERRPQYEEDRYYRQPEREYQMDSRHTTQNAPRHFDPYSSNVETLIRLVTSLPPSVTKQTGAHIIRQTMEAMGIATADVLTDARNAYSKMQKSINENYNKIEEHKILVRQLENDIIAYQRRAKELDDIISLFVLPDTTRHGR